MIKLKLGFLPRKNILSVDIGAYEIKIVQGRETKNSVIIDSYFSILTPKGSYEKGKIKDGDLIYNKIHECIKNKKIKTSNTYLTINNSFIITREIMVPKLEHDEIRSFLNFQIENYIPKNIENYILQFKIIDIVFDSDVEKYNILLIAIPKDIIESHFNILEKLDLNPLVLDYQPNCISKVIKNNDLINDKYSTIDLTFAAIDIGFDSTKVSIIKDSVIQVSRVVEIGGKYIDKILEESLDFNNLNENIKRIFKYYITRDKNNKIDMILLFGGYSNIKGISDLYLKEFNIPTIKLESFSNIDFDGEVSKYINSIGGLMRTKEVIL